MPHSPTGACLVRELTSSLPTVIPQAWAGHSYHQTAVQQQQMLCGTVLCCAPELLLSETAFQPWAVALQRKHTLSTGLYISWGSGGRCFASESVQGPIRYAGFQSPAWEGSGGRQFLWCSEAACDVLLCSIFALSLQQVKGEHSELRWHRGLEKSLITSS